MKQYIKMKEIISKYNNLSEDSKATIWYTINNILQKISPWLIMVILTHNVSLTEYGVYSVFLSWQQIFEIIVTMRIYSSGYIAGLIQKNEQEEKSYTSTIQSLCFVFILIWIFIFLIFYSQIIQLTKLSYLLVILIFMSFFSTVSYEIWNSRQRVHCEYKKIIKGTFLFSFIGPVSSVLITFLDFKDVIIMVIGIRVIIQLFMSVPFVLDNYACEIKWIESYAKEAVYYNLPLLPYYLSMILLNNLDKLMIQNLIGYEDAAIYSVARSASMMMFIVSGAFNLSMQTWLFKNLNDNNNNDNTKFVNNNTLFIAILIILMIVMAPEIILVLGGCKYIDAVLVMPPLIISVLIMFIYQQYVNILFFYKNTRIIMLLSIISALINAVLNYFFIPIYGYISAGYTAMISYLIIGLLFFKAMLFVCSKNNICYKNYFNIALQLKIVVITIILGAVCTIFYNYIWQRYLLFILLGVYTMRKINITNLLKMKD